MAVYDINRILVPDAPPEYEDHTRDVHYVPAPCQVACPIGTDAPSCIACIRDEDYEAAFEAITSTNPFSSICGRVCDAPCEPACRRVDSDGAVQIRNLKRFVMDKLGATYRPPAAPVTRSQSIGIVGAGPAGLVAAHDLCVAGYAVHVYEMTDRLGGMMIRGIPAFRLPPGIIDEDVDRLMQRCPCAAVRRARCLVPAARLMIPLASVSWGMASESDGTPDQNNGLFCPLTVLRTYSELARAQTASIGRHISADHHSPNDENCLRLAIKRFRAGNLTFGHPVPSPEYALLPPDLPNPQNACSQLTPSTQRCPPVRRQSLPAQPTLRGHEAVRLRSIPHEVRKSHEPSFRSRLLTREWPCGHGWFRWGVSPASHASSA